MNSDFFLFVAFCIALGMCDVVASGYGCSCKVGDRSLELAPSDGGAK